MAATLFAESLFRVFGNYILSPGVWHTQQYINPGVFAV